MGIFHPVQAVHGGQQGAQPRRGGDQDGDQAGQQQRPGLAARHIAQIVPHHQQHLVGQELVQGQKQIFQVQVKQADEVVDAHQQGEQGEDQEVGQGRRRPGRANLQIELRRLHAEGDRRE